MKTNLTALLAVALLAAAHAPARAAEGLDFSVSNDVGITGVQISVQDNATAAPVSNVSITLGDSLDGSSREYVTDAEGRLTIPAPAPKFITAKRPGYRSVTVAGASANQIHFFLKELPLESKTVMASGTMPRWDRGKNRNGNVKAGLIYRALSPADLLRFDMSTLISPIKDTIDVFGARQVPSNLSLPDQRVSVGIITVHLDKPVYRLPLAQGDVCRLGGLQLEIAAKDMMGGVDLKLFNKAKFKHVGLSETVTASSDFKQDVDASAQMADSFQVVASKPPFAADVLVTSITDVDGTLDSLLINDVKLAVDSAAPADIRPVNLSAPTTFGARKHLLTMAINQQTKEMSGIVTLDAGKVVKPGDFLGLRALRSAISAIDSISLRAPSQGVGMAMFEDPQGQTQWAVYILPAAGAVSIPTRQAATATSASIMQLDFGAGFNERALDGKSQLKTLSRFNRKSVTLQ